MRGGSRTHGAALVTAPSPARFLDELVALLKLAWPIVIAQLGMSVMNLVDTALVGPRGPEALAGLALGGTMYFGIVILGIGTLMSLDAHVSQAFGAGDDAGCRSGLVQGIWTAALLTPPLILALTWAPDVLVACGFDPATAALARLYLDPLRWGVPFGLLFVVHRSFLSAVGVTRPLLVSALLANIANVGLDLWFLDGGWFLPALGVEGVAWATALCRVILLLPVAWVAWFRTDMRRFVTTSWALDVVVVRHLLSIGVPVGLQYFAEVSAFSGAAILMGILGPEPLAAHQVALSASSMAFMVPLGLGAAGAVRVGQAVGRRDGHGLSLAAWTVLAVGGAWSLLGAAAFTLVPERIAGFFGVTGEVFALSLDLIAIAALFQISDSIQAVAVGVLRGLADTRAGFALALFGYAALALPMGILGAIVLSDDPRWIWWGLFAGLSAAAVGMCLRIRVQLRRHQVLFT